MSSRNRIPPLLDPYVRLPPEASLILITGVLNATPNWLVTRYLSGILGDGSTSGTKRAGLNEGDGVAGSIQSGNTGIILVSWMRDWEFWKTEARRGGGLDLARLAQQNRFAFVDGLTHLFDPSAGKSVTKTSSASSPVSLSSLAATTTSPASTRQPATTPPHRGPPVQRPAIQSTAAKGTASSARPNAYSLHSPSLTEAKSAIESTISSLGAHNDHIILVLDAPTLLLATTPTTSSDLAHFVLGLRSQVHSTLLIVEADAPLVAAARPGAFETTLGIESGATTTPLEAEHAAFVVGQAHVARWIVGTRPLDTGVARDVSGVVSVARGGGWDEDGEVEGADEGLEVLYYVQADGGVKVFERGAGDVG